MRRVLTTCLVLAMPAWAWAQPAAPVSQNVALVEFGLRGVSVEGDEARFNRYRDLRDGPTLDRFSWVADQTTWLFDASASHVGYRDQRFSARVEQFGRLRASFVWDQIPQFLSIDTRTPYSTDAAGALRLPDGVQESVQAGAATIRDVANLGSPFDTRTRRHVGDAFVSYMATPSTEVRFGLKTTSRSGEQPWGGPFGLSLVTEVSRPIDERTNDVTAGLEWASGARVFRVTYDGSFYTDHAPTLVWDNPVRADDRITTGQSGDGTSQGRMALPPSSTAHTISALGSVGLPARSRAHAYVSIGNWQQNGALVPHTINTAIPPIELDRPTAEVDARVISTNLGLTSRPTNLLWLNARVRVYDFDNRTPFFAQPTYVRMDQDARVSSIGGTEAFSYTRTYVDLDASFSPWRFAAFQAGYGREHDDRTFRFLEETTEHTLRLSMDTTGLSWMTVRALYEHANRTGEGLDEEVLGDIGEQISLRQYDISDRVRNRFTTTVYVSPLPMLGVQGSVGVGTDRRPDTAFGFQENDHQTYGVGLDMVADNATTAGVSYDYERYDTLQRSRQGVTAQDLLDPRRDWSTDVGERVHTGYAYVDMPGLVAGVDVRVDYDFMTSRASYVYILAPNSVLATPDQLTPVTHTRHLGRVDARRALSRRVTLGLAYAYERYDVDDFAYQNGTLEPLGFPGSGLYLGATWRPYRAHVGWFRVLYGW